MTRHPFAPPRLPEGFAWHHEPALVSFERGLILVTRANTDFWQRTHYGFCRDNGHFLGVPRPGDFALRTRVESEPRAQYDQAGLMVRVDAMNWIKCSAEFESATSSRLGSVVTQRGYSDWATQDLPSRVRTVEYRIQRAGQDFLIEHSFDGSAWHQMRIAHLEAATGPVSAGLYACSPVGEGFRCRFEFLEIGPSRWAQGPVAAA